jgi:phycocyanin alpha chain
MPSQVPTSYSIASADSTGRFPSSLELEAVSKHLKKSQLKLSAAEVLSRNLEELAQAATQFVFKKYPEAVKADKFIFSFLSENVSHSFKEDIEMFVRLLSYFLLAELDNSKVDNRFMEIVDGILLVVRENPEINLSWYIEALQYLKRNIGLSGDISALISSYIDYMICGFS